MKRSVLLIILFYLAVIGYSQTVYDIQQLPPINKGRIVLLDGTQYEFNHILIDNDTVIVTSSQAILHYYSSDDIYRISKIGNYGVEGFIAGALGGLLGGISGTRNWKTNPVLRGKESQYIIAATVVCGLIGGITGAFIEKDETIYKNETAFSFDLSPVNINNSRHLMLSLKINL